MGLPDELILQIVSYIDNSTQLCDLALTCHKIGLIAQEALYSSVILPTPKRLKCVSLKGHCSRVLCFLRTLLDRPDLANKIQRLILVTVDGHIECSNWCKPPYALGECTFSQLLTRLQPIIQQSDIGGSKWLSHLNESYEPAFAGVILLLVPNLKELSIEKLSDSIFRHTREVKAHELPLSGEVTLKDFFGIVPGEVKAAKIPQWNKLETLTTNGSIDYPILAQPLLRHLHIDLDIGRKIECPPPYGTFPTIEFLTLRCGPRVCWRENSLQEGSPRIYLTNLMRQLCRLRKVHVYLQGERKEYFPISRGCDVLLDCMAAASQTLETLIIDGFLGSALDHYDFEDEVESATTLRNFTNLRRLVIESYCMPYQIPDNFFPDNLESLEIIAKIDPKDRVPELLDCRRKGGLQKLERFVNQRVGAEWYESKMREDPLWKDLRMAGVSIERGVDEYEKIPARPEEPSTELVWSPTTVDRIRDRGYLPDLYTVIEQY